MIEDNMLPDGFQAMIRTILPPTEANILLSSLNEEPETSVRLNRHKPHNGELFPDMTPVDWCNSGKYLPERPRFTSDPLLHAGVYYVQDASSMIYENIVSSLAGATPIKVADLCAAPGGKTTAILNALQEGSVMLANEFVPSRANILKENLSKYGYPEVIVTNSDTSTLSEMSGMFDMVAVDAPCSGEGMMRKEAAARTQWSESLIRQCSALQRKILESAVEMLAPGGYLIYSTCTFNTTENEDNARWIVDNFGLEPIDTGLAGKYGIRKEIKGDIPCLRFLPGYTRGEGLFVAVFQKQEDLPGASRKKKGKKKSSCKTKTDRKLLDIAKSWLTKDVEIIDHEGHLIALTPTTASLLESIPASVRIISAGIEIGEIKGKDLIPAHQLAMSTLMAPEFPTVELNKDQALQYLSREAIPLPAETPKGFVAVKYLGHTLGFMKNNGNRANNLYPNEYRIRNLKQTT